MSAINALKVLARSHSMEFTRSLLALGSASAGAGAGAVNWWSGDGRDMHYRRGTVDLEVIYHVLLKGGRKGEYWLPKGLEPACIFDIGGNIGAASRYFAHRFPSAMIHCFEPIPQNCELLRKNLQGTAVTVHDYGLAAASGSFEFRQAAGAPANPGGYSMARDAQAGGPAVRGQVRAVAEVLRELGEPSIDIIKIDVEGAEYEILEAFPDHVLAEATWIYGELHAEMAGAGPAFALLARLARWFDIEVHKSLRKRNWFFDACSKRASERFRRFRRAR